MRLRYRAHGASWEPNAQRLAARHGLVVVADTPVLPGVTNALLRMPAYVALSVDLRGSEAEYRAALASSARADLQKIRARRLTSEISHDPEWAEEFHREFHRPTVWNRHGEEGVIMPAADVADLIRRGNAEFLIIAQDGQRVGAILNEAVGDAYAMRRLGWLRGNPAWPREGVVSALYWHSMQRARALGIRRVQFGGTPPILDDGLFQYKGKWNVALDRAATAWGHYFMMLSPAHAHARRMLEQHALIVFNARDELVVLSARHPGDVRMSHALASTIAGWYRLCPTPDAGRGRDNVDLPASIRSWFCAEPIPQAAPPAPRVRNPGR